MRQIALLTVSVALAYGQGTSSGWSHKDSLSKASVIVIGTLTGGRASDSGQVVQCSGTLSPERVLKGDAKPSYSLRWEYRPNPGEPPSVTTNVGQPYGLWLLEALDDGYRPLQVDHVRLGGVYLELPADRQLGPLQYSPEASHSSKLAAEVGAAMEMIATKAGAALNQERHFSSEGGFSGRITPVQVSFMRLADVLAAVEPVDSRRVFDYFLRSPLANLRAVAIDGLMRAGDPQSVFALERDIRDIAPALRSPAIGMSLSNLQAIDNPDLVHALGRLATGEHTVPMLDGQIAFRLGWSKRMEALPYLVTMLEHPQETPRVQAMTAVCTLLRSDGRFWKLEMESQCPNRSPLNDRALEQRYLAFWKSWWTSRPEPLAAMRQVNPPARYKPLFDTKAPVPVEVTLDMRFGAFVRMQRSRPPNFPKYSGLQLSDRDAGVFDQIVKTLGEAFTTHEEQSRSILNEARLQSRRPDVEKLRALSDQLSLATKASLERAQRDLSPEGWAALQRHLMDIGMSVSRMGQ